MSYLIWGYCGFQPSSAGFVGGSQFEFGRIAGAARLFNCRDFFTGDFFAHLDDFLHRITIAISKIEKSALARCQTQDMRLREILDVNITRMHVPSGVG